MHFRLYNTCHQKLFGHQPISFLVQCFFLLFPCVPWHHLSPYWSGFLVLYRDLPTPKAGTSVVLTFNCLTMSYVSYHSCWFWNILSSSCANHSTLLPLKTSQNCLPLGILKVHRQKTAGFNRRWSSGSTSSQWFLKSWCHALRTDTSTRSAGSSKTRTPLFANASWAKGSPEKTRQKEGPFFFRTGFRRRKNMEIANDLVVRKCDMMWYDVICEFWIGSNPVEWQAMPTYAWGYSNYVSCINIGQASQSIWASFPLKTTHTQKRNNHQWILKVNLYWFWKNTSYEYLISSHMCHGQSMVYEVWSSHHH